MPISTSLDIEIGGFESNIKQAQGVLKGLNAEMKAADAAFKATGNAEQKLTSQTKTLNSTIQMQKGIADQARQALDAMTKAGVDPLDKEYQKLYATMVNAEAGMNEAQAALNQLGAGTAEAASGAEKLTSGLNGISKKISLDQVISGIDKITSGLANAGKKAVELGKQLWNNIVDVAAQADDIATQARVFGMTPEYYQKYKNVFDTIGEITIQEWASTRRKVERAMVDPSSDQIDVLAALGFGSMVPGKNGGFEQTVSIAADNWEDAFWQISSEIKKRVDSGEMSSAMADVYGEALFGKKFTSMWTLIDMGQEAFTAAVEKQTVAEDEAIQKNAELSDAVTELKQSFAALEQQMLSGLAPAFTKGVTAVGGMIDELTAFLQTERGQELLDKMGSAISDMLSGIGDISAEDVVSNFSSLLGSLTEGLDWISKNGTTVTGIIEGLGIAFAGLTISSGVLEFVKIVSGAKGLFAGGSAAKAATGGVGAAAGSGVTTGAAAAAAGILGNPLLQANVPVVGDWFMNNTNVGRALGGKHGDTWESVGNDFEQWQRDTAKRIQTFLSDWSHLGDPNYNNGNNQGFTIEPSVEIPPEEKAKIQEQIDAMPPATLKVLVQFMPETSSLPDGTSLVPGKANGIWAVPYDGYLASLHKGERVVPAREIASRSFSSNLYVENMNMGGGMSADALAATIAARNRRMMAGYGS